MFLRTLIQRTLFRSAPPRAQLPSPTFFCAVPYFLPVLPYLATTKGGRFLSTNPISHQLQTTSASTSPPPPPQPAISSSDHSVTDSASLATLFPLLKLQPSHYITIHINNFPFLVTPGDQLTLPFRLPDVSVGDVLRLTHASVLGSRDYTIKGGPFIDSSLFELRARVVEVTSEPMRIKIKKKQRNRRKKTVKSKHRYTVLRIGELILKDLPAEGVAVGAAQV
ncbi:ribosomal protein L21-like protein [Kalaharituber pfeilii]|nr:ribosomal protein L21-like protein [Kalaharituber pfeilii]